MQDQEQVSKSGRTHWYGRPKQDRMKVTKGISRQGNLGKALSRKMIALRLSGWTDQQCQEWLEEVITQIEQAEKETLNDQEH